MGKGNKKAKGTKGNKGGTGRPPKSEKDLLSKLISFRVTDELYDRVNVATMQSGGDNVGVFIRDLLTATLPS